MTFDLESNEMTKKSTNNIQIPAITSKVQEKKKQRSRNLKLLSLVE